MNLAAKIIAWVTVLPLTLLFISWILSLVWNHFPFLVAVHQQTPWDMFLTVLLCGVLFRGFNK